MKVRVKFMGKTTEQTGSLSAFQTTFLLLQRHSMGLWMCEKRVLHTTPKCVICRKAERGKGVSNIIEKSLTCRSSQEEGSMLSLPAWRCPWEPNAGTRRCWWFWYGGLLMTLWSHHVKLQQNHLFSTICWAGDTGERRLRLVRAPLPLPAHPITVNEKAFKREATGSEVNGSD